MNPADSKARALDLLGKNTPEALTELKRLIPDGLRVLR
jgi:hypothetical protein